MSPSILSANFAKLGEQVSFLEFTVGESCARLFTGLQRRSLSLKPSLKALSPLISCLQFYHLLYEAAVCAVQVTAVIDAGAQWVHVDVMDGRFVPSAHQLPLSFNIFMAGMYSDSPTRTQPDVGRTMQVVNGALAVVAMQTSQLVPWWSTPLGRSQMLPSTHICEPLTSCILPYACAVISSNLYAIRESLLHTHVMWLFAGVSGMPCPSLCRSRQRV